MRRWVASTAAVVVTITGVAGCTNPPPSRTAATLSVAPSPTATAATSAPSPSVPGCPAASPAADVAPTDFPHPALASRAAVTGDSSADDALAAQGLAATRAFGGPISTAAFQHYLDATGDYLTLPVDGLLSADPALVSELNGVLVAAAAAAVQQVVHAPASTCPSVAFTSGWQPHADVADSDWRLTLGRFYVEVSGTVSRAPDPTVASTGSARVTYRAAFGDTYDFDPGTAFASFAQLAADGRAAVYLDGGVTTGRSATVVAGSAELASTGFA